MLDQLLSGLRFCYAVKFITHIRASHIAKLEIKLFFRAAPRHISPFLSYIRKRQKIFDISEKITQNMPIIEDKKRPCHNKSLRSFCQCRHWAKKLAFYNDGIKFPIFGADIAPGSS